jgi:hypothetical protein
MSADHTLPPRLPLVLLASGLFALAHTQSPLFFSNQNQYLLHGLAQAGYGHLATDWLATTKDPTPVFSTLVSLLFRTGGLFAIQVAHFVLLTGYFAAMWSLVSALGPVRFLPYAAMFTAAHAALFRLLSVRLLDVDYPWYFQAGVAGQYVLGPGLQPSAFGVLLVASLAAFAHGRIRLAAVLAAGSTLFHATYLFPAALLTIGYAIRLIQDGKPKDAVRVCAVSLAIAVPLAIYVYESFADGGVKSNGAAQSVLANIRIPHHAQVGRWFDVVAGAQVAWIALGLLLLRRTRPGIPLAVAAALGALFTVVQTFANNDAFALMFPWRISVVLVPVATAAVAARLSLLDRESRVIDLLGGMLMLVQAAGGAAILVLGLGYAMNESEVPLLNHVREHARPGDSYLIPTRIPPLASGARGAKSTSFTPPPRPKPGSNLIPVDLQRFRLATGAAIYVDFKSVPYSTTEVHEWHRRMVQAEAWYDEKSWEKSETQAALKKEGVTHIVLTRGSPSEPLLTAGLELQYADAAYAVYRLK